jgi:hypothetical protein
MDVGQTDFEQAVSVCPRPTVISSSRPPSSLALSARKPRMAPRIRKAIDEALAGAAFGSLFIAIVTAILLRRYDALGIAAVALWLLTGLP